MQVVVWNPNSRLEEPVELSSDQLAALKQRVSEALSEADWVEADLRAAYNSQLEGPIDSIERWWQVVEVADSFYDEESWYAAVTGKEAGE